MAPHDRAPAVTANLPATLGKAAATLERLDGPVPSTVRAKALKAMPGVVAALEEIATNADGPRGPAVQASKLLAEIAAVRATASVPRDVVDERLRQTAEFLRAELGDDRFAAMADTLTRVWNI